MILRINSTYKNVLELWFGSIPENGTNYSLKKRKELWHNLFEWKNRCPNLHIWDTSKPRQIKADFQPIKIL